MTKEWFQERGDRVMLVRYDDGAYRWRVWGAPGGEGPVSGLLPTLEEAKAKAEEVAGFGLKPADPAWMVEVAREVNAQRCEKQGFASVAAQYRSGDCDTWPEMEQAMKPVRLALERGHVVEADPIREMLFAGQGDDDGSQILPDLHDGMTLHAMVAACVHLLERRRDALDGYANSGREPRPVPSEEEMLKAARPAAQAAADVLAERRRQVEVEGWTPEHDNCNDKGEMARAAGCYALLAGGIDPPMTRAWPWSREWWKPGASRRMLVKAGALILAEIERQDRRARGVMLPHEYKRLDDPPPSP